MRRALVVAALVLLALPAAPARAADPTFSVTVSPDRVIFGETKELTYRVEITTRAEPERFTLIAGMKASLVQAGTEGMQLEGEGSLNAGPIIHSDGFPCLPWSDMPRRPSTQNAPTYELEIPAQTTSTLVFPGYPSRHAAFPDQRYELDIRASNIGGGTLESAVDLAVPAPEPGGRTGVRIDVASDPPSSFCQPPANPGRPVTISGKTDPALAGQEMLLRVVPPGSHAAVDLATVRIASDGAFAAPPWRPKAVGVYQFAAIYRTQDPQRTDDFSSIKAFELTAPVPDEAPAPTEASVPVEAPVAPTAAGTAAPRLMNHGLRATRDGLVRLRLYCPLSTGGDCLGAIRLRAGGRTVASRGPVRVQAGSARTVRVRLSRRARLRVMRRPVRVSVRIGARTPAPATLRARR